MTLQIEFFDETNKALYAILFNSSDQAYKPATQTFASYTDATIDDFDRALTESITRAGRYSTDFSGSIPKGIYQIEIYSQAGGSPSKSADALIGVGDVYWNGTNVVESLGNPSLVSSSKFGPKDLDDELFFFARTFDEFGEPVSADAAPEFVFYSNSGSMNTSGDLSEIDTGLYFGNVTLTSGIFNYTNNYTVSLSATVKGADLITQPVVEIQSPVDIANVSVDVPGQLGYVSLTVQAGSTTTAVTTNLSNTNNDFYNGQILRIAGQARIISDYDGTSKTLTLNKALTSAPASGTSALIYPIGGELNVP